jgi:hypothetical protein
MSDNVKRQQNIAESNVKRRHCGARMSAALMVERQPALEPSKVEPNVQRPGLFTVIQPEKNESQNAVNATKLLLLRDLGVKLGMFGDQPTGWPGRRPRGYHATETMSVEELVDKIELLKLKPLSQEC